MGCLKRAEDGAREATGRKVEEEEIIFLREQFCDFCAAGLLN